MGKRKTYSNELKQKVVDECRQIGNTALVARRHGISKHTVYSWGSKFKKEVLLHIRWQISKYFPEMFV